MYAAVPRIIPGIDADLSGESDTVALAGSVSKIFASPKSSTFTVPSGRSLMFAGFRSLWMIPCS